MLVSFEAFAAYLRKTSGLVIDTDKRYLVESRVLPIMRREKLKDLADLVQALERGRIPGLANEVVQAMTINETYFFRDKSPFDAFSKTLLPRLVAANADRKTIRIWSAACSSGQEPYSLAMIAEEHSHLLRGWRVEILATDLAEHVLTKAREGIYSQFEVQRGLTPEQLKRHFTQAGGSWQLKAGLRSMVTFRSFNLLADYGPLGQFDVVLCRNVLIYFDQNQKGDVIRRMARILSPQGCLMLGASEGMVGKELVSESNIRGGYRLSTASPKAQATGVQPVAAVAAPKTVIPPVKLARPA